MVQYKDAITPRKLLATKQEIPKTKKQPALENDKFLICDDCKHNCITYEPSNEGRRLRLWIGL